MSIHERILNIYYRLPTYIERLINTIYVILVFFAFLIIGLLFSRDMSCGTIDETDTWYYFFAAIMETFGAIIGILVAIVIYSSKSDRQNREQYSKTSESAQTIEAVQQFKIARKKSANRDLNSKRRDDFKVKHNNGTASIDNKYVLRKSSWLITLGIFIIIICIISLYYTELIWQLRTDGVKFLGFNYKSFLTSSTIYLCIFYLLSIVLFLRELLGEDVEKKFSLRRREVLVLSFSFVGFIFGIGINVIKYISV